MINYANIIKGNGKTIEIQNIASNVKWELWVDGNISLSQYRGSGNATIDIEYSSWNPYGTIKFTVNSTCPEDYTIIKFPFDENIDTPYFIADTFPIYLYGDEEYNLTVDSKYGTSISSDTYCDISVNSTESGKTNVSVSAKQDYILSSFSGNLMITEKKTNAKKIIKIFKSPKVYNFIKIFNNAGNDCSYYDVDNNLPHASDAKAIQVYPNKYTYFYVYSNSKIKSITEETNVTPPQYSLNISNVDENLYKVRLINPEEAIAIIVIFTNENSESAAALFYN